MIDFFSLCVAVVEQSVTPNNSSHLAHPVVNIPRTAPNTPTFLWGSSSQPPIHVLHTVHFQSHGWVL